MNPWTFKALTEASYYKKGDKVGRTYDARKFWGTGGALTGAGAGVALTKIAPHINKTKRVALVGGAIGATAGILKGRKHNEAQLQSFHASGYNPITKFEYKTRDRNAVAKANAVYQKAHAAGDKDATNKAMNIYLKYRDLGDKKFKHVGHNK